MGLGRRILPLGFEFSPFNYHDKIIQIDDFGDWNVYDGKKFLGKFPHCRDAMAFIDRFDEV